MIGITSQAQVGFLTKLEALQYCHVGRGVYSGVFLTRFADGAGSYLKNPKLPIWVVGSETHLTVLFR